MPSLLLLRRQFQQAQVLMKAASQIGEAVHVVKKIP
jgi:hypothetical protein